MINTNDFDYNFYIHIYKDLKKNGINTFEKAYKHLIDSGINENRYYTFEDSKIFYENSWQLYINHNSDLKNIKTEFDAYQHYMLHGKKEDRKLYELEIKDINNFNWDLFEIKFYTKINNLKLKNEDDIKKHFKQNGYKLNLLHGIKHSEIYFKYDWDKYISDHDDLLGFNRKNAFIHYINFGQKEERKIFEKYDINLKLVNFNWKFYLLANNDLISNNITDKKTALKHFKSCGYKEDRPYSHYHYLLYINHDWIKYSDMYNLNKNELNSFKYYLRSGMNNQHKIYFSINEGNFYKQFFIEFNNLKDLKTFDECKLYYLKLKTKIPYSYEHYLIYKLFNWVKIFDNNKNYFNTCEINNHQQLLIEYVNNHNKFKIKLILNENVDDIYKLDNIDTIFTNTSLIKQIIHKNIIYNDSSFLLDLYDIQNKLQTILSFYFEFLTIPPGFEFNKFEYNNENLRFTFIVSSFNNKDNIYNNLLSIIYQNYSNWKIYYTNDFSNDNTHELFHQIVEEYNLKDKIHYEFNEVNMKQSYSKYNSYKILKNNDIVCILDGDDWLSTNEALSILADEYNNSNNLVIYSGYHVYYDNKIDKTVHGTEYPDIVKESSGYRKYKNWLFTHLKTGYAWLFKKIPIDYFKMNNKWLDRCTDLAEMYSVCEIANTNVKHLDKILYVYNKKNSIIYDNSYYNDHNSDIRKNTEEHIKNLKPLSVYLPKIYVINLENREDLKQQMIENFAKFNIKDYEFFKALNGYTNKKIKNRYDEYNLKYDNNLIPQVTLTVTKKHINSLGALGIIYSTIELYKNINKNKDIDHVLILEDDVYLHKDFNILYNIINRETIGKDFIYLGFNSLSIELNNIFKNESNKNLIELQKNHYYEGGIYGAYSYICSRKYREHVISLGVDFYINNNINLDSAINIFLGNDEVEHVKNDLTFYIFNTHLFIPEVRKNGINISRSDNFYKDRFINLDNYLI